MKKLMILGGSSYIVPVINEAHELGCYVITCDYLPDNIAHKFSDHYENISIIDKEAVLEAAKRLRIDGIISFACDPGVVTAAYVAEMMGLPFQGSYESVRILQDKGLFRKFLADNGFNTPKAKRYTDKHAPLSDTEYFTWPVIVKPTDSAGSKGVTRVDSPAELPGAIDTALKSSHNGAFIIEDFLTFKGFHSSADPFTVNGELAFVSYSDQLFDPDAENAYTPALIIWPSTMEKSAQENLTRETQRLMHLLDMKTGLYNIESCVTSNGLPCLMEVSPRGGGCKIAELQELAMGVPLIENEIRGALGLPLLDMCPKEIHGHWCEMVLHAKTKHEGVLQSIEIDDAVMRKYVKLTDITAKPGDVVKPFTGANMSLGNMFLHFDTREELDEVMAHSGDWLRIHLRE